ncbi:mammalian cell entry protein (plasmid) [Mycolicibacterium madagascariense]|uniref:Mammalian cell entry protein n=1 Tax=Mycolicibacterium madagascariense TaxID=212765 RepID=A0A7I7XQ65_9MYCO|nr:MCE family protein [Mycolicibacterium madagascariense]BBZ31253.1 mammalian cell entry protein [Mycolicibacterium madagascariense]
MKSFSERNLFVVGVVGVVLTVGTAIAALNFHSLPFVDSNDDYSAAFAEAGGLRAGAPVQVAGYRVGQVSSVDLDGTHVLVKFDVQDDVRLGQLTEANIRTKSLLGSKVLEVTPRGDGRLAETIPLARTRSPYQLPDALGDLSSTINGLNTDSVSNALATLSDTFKDTPPALRDAVAGVGRFSQSLGDRDAQLRTLLANASKATSVLSARADEIVQLVSNSNALLAALRTQSTALQQVSGNLSAFAQQLKGFIADNGAQLRPALDKLNGVLTIVDNRKNDLTQAIKYLNQYAMSLGDAVGSGPFFKAMIPNLLPGQLSQPFIDAAFRDLGLDPTTLAPSQASDPQTGQPGTPPLPVPYPRTGQAGDPRLNLPDAITGNPGDEQCGPPGLPLPGPGCYPLREQLPPTAPGGPPPGPPLVPPGSERTTDPTPAPIFVPAPGEPGSQTTASEPTGGQ